MRIEFIENENATEADAVNVTIRDMKIRSRIHYLKEDLNKLLEYRKRINNG